MNDARPLTRKDDNQTLGLAAFLQLVSPDIWEELKCISVTSPFPLQRSMDDLEGDQLSNPEDLAFANPEQAKAWLRKRSLEDQIWAAACQAVAVEDWECRARPEGQIQFEDISAEVLPRARPLLEDETIAFHGELFEDVQFSPSASGSVDQLAIKFVKEFCSHHDPKAHTVKDIQAAVRENLGYEMTDGRVRALMKVASVDTGWFAPGRRAAKPARS